MAGSQPFAWHGYLAWAMLGLGFASALAIVVDELVLGRRQEPWIMNVVHPVTALYLGPLWLWAYATRDRKGPHRHVAHAVSHCGAGCTLGDVLGEWVVLTAGIAWFGRWSGHALPSELLLDFACAWTLGILFQYFTLGEQRLRGLWAAIKVDTASIVAFQVGLFGWMAIFMLVIWPHHGIRVDSPDFWFQMQIGMACGFATAWPVNRLLVATGVKE